MPLILFIVERAYRHVIADVGDDDIAIKSGANRLSGPDEPSRDLVIRDCTFCNGHGLFNWK